MLVWWNEINSLNANSITNVAKVANKTSMPHQSIKQTELADCSIPFKLISVLV